MSTATTETFEITKTPEEWRKILTPEQYYVLREHGTERAGTSPLDKNYARGVYECAACALPLFSSEAKFNSGTGWPSFFKPLDGAIGTSVDKGFFMTRTEVHCRRCGGHLGHVFDDGPPPTGLRYCMNGVALKFVPGQEKSTG
jgi:peptide-methionine (R)-S-oxide reductase